MKLYEGQIRIYGKGKDVASFLKEDFLPIINRVFPKEIEGRLTELKFRNKGAAAKKLDRNFIGIEIDLEYFKIAQERIAEG